MNIKCSYPMSLVTSFRCGGRADFFVCPEEMRTLLNLLTLHKNRKLFILGNGTNTLFSDTGFNGLVICTKNLSAIRTWGSDKTEDVFVECECGVSLFALHAFLVENSLSGLEFAFGIPASIGGAVVTNCGAFGQEIGEFVESVEVFENGKTRKISKNEIFFSYRNSSLKNYIVLKIVLRLKKGDKKYIIDKQQEILQKRKLLQPLEYASAGSVFKRQGDVIPAKIIEELDLKGFSIGGAQISRKHAGFIINTGGASATDVINLIKFVESKVFEERKIRLEREIIIVE